MFLVKTHKSTFHYVLLFSIIHFENVLKFSPKLKKYFFQIHLLRVFLFSSFFFLFFFVFFFHFS